MASFLSDEENIIIKKNYLSEYTIYIYIYIYIGCEIFITVPNTIYYKL